MVAPNAVAENVFGTLGAVFVRRTDRGSQMQLSVAYARLTACSFFLLP